MFIAAAVVAGQTANDIVATAAGKNFTPASLSADGQKLYAEREASSKAARRGLLNGMIQTMLIDLESKAMSVTPEKLLAGAFAKIADPTAAEVQAFYNTNSSQFGGRTFAQMQAEIREYLKRSREQKADDAYFKTLETKYKVSAGRDVNADALKSSDVLVTVLGKAITVQEFDNKNKVRLNDLEVGLFEDIMTDLKSSIASVLLAAEAKERGVESTAVYAAEVSDKLKDYTDQEKSDLEAALQNRLLKKYDAKFVITPPARLVQNISVDDDPSIGPAAAPVTIVMFTDFQCPACAAAYPVLKGVMSEFPNRIRFVVRDYPLTSLHKNAFRAALAANAANAQGKFFEYTAKLYVNQEALDDASLKKHAAGLGLNPKKFELDLNDEKTAAEVRKDMAEAAVYGVSWTPTIYVNGTKVQRGSADNIRDAINAALGK